MKKETSGANGLLPVEKLVHVERGQIEVGVTVGLLSKVDFTNLKYMVNSLCGNYLISKCV